MSGQYRRKVARAISEVPLLRMLQEPGSDNRPPEGDFFNGEIGAILKNIYLQTAFG